MTGFKSGCLCGEVEMNFVLVKAWGLKCYPQVQKPTAWQKGPVSFKDRKKGNQVSMLEWAC